jgi:hypothetical protein
MRRFLLTVAMPELLTLQGSGKCANLSESTSYCPELTPLCPACLFILRPKQTKEPRVLNKSHGTHLKMYKKGTCKKL